jgi:hypothetical protein
MFKKYLKSVFTPLSSGYILPFLFPPYSRYTEISFWIFILGCFIVTHGAVFLIWSYFQKE